MRSEVKTEYPQPGKERVRGKTLPERAPALPTHITAESITVSLLSVVLKRSAPVMQERRTTNFQRLFAIIGSSTDQPDS